MLHVLSMGDIGQDILAVDTFYIGGKKTRAHLSATEIFIDCQPPAWCQKRPGVIPFLKIVSTECRQDHKTSITRHRLVKSLRLSKFSFGLFKRGYRTFDYEYEAGDDKTENKDGYTSITIHYVEEDKEKGLIKLKQLPLQHADSDVLAKWSTLIQNSISSLSRRPKKLLVFINPFGGKGKAKKLWEDKISKIFKLGGIQSKVIVTEEAKHALSLLQTVPLHGYDGVVSVGGDGMFAEVFNGVIIRAARDGELDVDDKTTQFARPGFRVGFIPGGSTDSISMCLHGTTDPTTAALHILLGDRMMVDVVSIHSQEKLERFAMTMVSYGYFGDLMTHSEKYRWLGRSRYSVSGVRTFLANRSYTGTVRYSAEDDQQPGLLAETCGEGCPTCSGSEEEIDQKSGEEEDITRKDNVSSEDDPDVDDGNFFKTREFEVEGRFLAVSSATLSCSCPHSVPGLSPAAHTGDGTTDLIIVHNTSHLNYLRYLFRTAFHQSHPFSLPFVQAVRVTSWSFTPQDERKHSTWNCDGEILDNPQIFVKPHRQLVPVFARGVYNKRYETERKLSEEAEMFDTIPVL